ALTADPLAGSYYVEHLTNALEEQATALLARVDALGGAACAIEAGFLQKEIARSAYEYQLRVENGETVIVGMNRFAEESDDPVMPAPDYSALEHEQVTRVTELRARRDDEPARRALAALGDDAATYAGDANGTRAELMPRIVDAVRARATVGEISDVLRDRWGTYRPA
ncbi:MAG TPA: methylmalonyl-CoA mutase family protein, partial [Gemmatimonadaceae bacterium]|nr:methylmalonyl-CoA mutase family protein [Gemmatimonadaceae bacterium]